MELITGLMTIALPALATLALSLLKKVLTFIDDQSRFIQQIVAVVVGVGVTTLAALTGATLPLDVHAWDQVAVLGLLNGLAAIGIHAVRKGK